MDAKQFLAEFKHIASAPNGIQRLRQLILSLAVQGKLVEQNENDEPASLLLERIKKESKIAFVDLKEQSHSAILPKKWIFIKLSSCIQLISGQHLDKNEQNEKGDGLPYLTGPADFGKIHPTATRWTTTPKVIAKKNDILITVKGAGVGKSNILALEEAAIGRQLMAIRPVITDLKFMYLWVLASFDKFQSLSLGTTVPGIGREDILNTIFYLPPLEEQKRIVAKVDELMALCDKLEAQQREREALRKLTLLKTLDALVFARSGNDLYIAWQRVQAGFHILNDVPESVSVLKKTIFDLAIQGNLSAPSEGDISVMQILSEIGETRKQQGNDQGKARILLDSINNLDRPFEIPSHWQWVRLDQLAQLVEYGTSQKAHEEPRGIPVLRMGNLSDGQITYSNLKYVNDDIDELPRLFLKTNDLIFNRTNSYELVGKMSIFKGESDTFTFASYLIRVTLFLSWVNPYYINMYFQSTLCRRFQIEPNITVQTNQANFNGTKLKAVLIPLPPLEEQTRIIKLVNTLVALCDQLEQLQQRLINSGNTLAEASISAITGIKIKDKEKMKAPKTELVSNLRIGEISPTNKEQSPLTTILIKQGELPAKALWSTSGLEIDAFYQQLKTEMAKGWIVQPEVAYVKEVEVI